MYLILTTNGIPQWGGVVHLWPQTNFSLAYGAACNTKRYHLKKALLYHMTATREGKGYHVFPLRHMIPATCIFLNCCSYSVSGGITHLEESTTSTYCTWAHRCVWLASVTVIEGKWEYAVAPSEHMLVLPSSTWDLQMIRANVFLLCHSGAQSRFTFKVRIACNCK